MPRFPAVQNGKTSINARWRFNKELGMGGDAEGGINLKFLGNKSSGAGVTDDRSRNIQMQNVVQMAVGEDTNGIDYQNTIDTQSGAAGHASAFQARQWVTGGGSTEAVRGYMCKFIVDSGVTASDMKGFRYFDPDDDDTNFTPTRTHGGTIDQQVAYWCETLNEATVNYAWFSEDQNQHVFGGNIDIVSTAGNANADIIQYSDTATSSGDLFLRKAGGTETTPTAVPADDQIGMVAWNGRGATAFRQAARLIVEADETFTDSASGSRMIFKTTPNTTTTAQEVMRLNNDGSIRIPEITATPGAPAADHVVLYVREGAGAKTELVARFPTGAVQSIAIEP